MQKICEICKLVPATVHLTDIKNNVKKELHMCEACAAKKGIDIKKSVSLKNIFESKEASNQTQPQEVQHKAKSDIACDKCGCTWREFRETGRLGCANDYKVFAKGLIPLLEDIHSAQRHNCGKAPDSARDTSIQKTKIELQQQLREAVAQENYEEAAVIRDKILALNIEANHA